MNKSKLIEYFGSQESLAKFLDIKVQSVNSWGDTIPMGRAYELVVKTGGQLAFDPSLYEKGGHIKKSAPEIQP